MKLDNGIPRSPGENRGDGKRGARKTMTPLPVAWMDPMSWRLPSGKALAEFALQSGFLAPLMLGSSMGDGRIRRPQKPTAKKSAEGVPASPGSFRSAAVQQAGNRGFPGEAFRGERLGDPPFGRRPFGEGR